MLIDFGCHALVELWLYLFLFWCIVAMLLPILLSFAVSLLISTVELEQPSMSSSTVTILSGEYQFLLLACIFLRKH